MESIEVIFASGNDLLGIINDILDLSKVEAGQLRIYIEKTAINDIMQPIINQFKPIAKDKKVEFLVEIDDNIPEYINTDAQRIKQILKNLLSNAFKFTHQGKVSCQLNLSDTREIIFSVIDTGIGVPENKQHAIFEAFQQVDGSDRRQFGGTGLGLAISIQLAEKLGGHIELHSEENKGSTFNLYLPLDISTKNEQPVAATQQTQRQEITSEMAQLPCTIADEMPIFVADDRDNIEQADKVVLIIEDDENFVKILQKVAHEQNFKCLIAGQVKHGVVLAVNAQPDAIILDLTLPDMQGYDIVQMLKEDKRINHIPVHIISANDDDDDRRQQAIGYLTKPVTLEQLDQVFHDLTKLKRKDSHSILVVEDDTASQQAIIKLLQPTATKITVANLVSEAYDFLKQQSFDCIILDLSLPDKNGKELLDHLFSIGKSDIPIIIYTGKELDEIESQQLQIYANSIIIKGSSSPERLLDEVNLFLHQVDTPEAITITACCDNNINLADKTIMLIDDNMRNNYSLAKFLRQHELTVIMAENGNRGLENLQKNVHADIILVDLLMPEMDGYDTIKAIRQQDNGKTVPIIALSSKGEDEERKACLAVGANDYLIKPVDTEKLLSLLKIWLQS